MWRNKNIRAYLQGEEMNLEELKATIERAKEGFVVRCPYERKEHKVETPEEMLVIFSALEAALKVVEAAEEATGIIIEFGSETEPVCAPNQILIDALQHFKDCVEK